MLYLYQVGGNIGGNILILGGLFMGWSTKSKFLSVEPPDLTLNSENFRRTWDPPILECGFD